MNERLREIAIKAQVEHCISHVRLEEFAELIVRECAGVELYWLNEQDRKAVAEKIKEHFGVEE